MRELLRKKSVRIMLLIIILAVVIGIAGINAQGGRKEKEYNRHMDAAEKYLSDLDYEQAIAEYILAMEIEPKEEVLDALENAYLDYAQALVDAGGLEGAAADTEVYEKVIAVLEEGYAFTGAESLMIKIEELKQFTKMPEDGQADEEASAEEEYGMVTLPFDMTDITIKGYDLLSDHFEEVIVAYGCPLPGEGNSVKTDKGWFFDHLEADITYQIEDGSKILDVFPADGGAAYMRYISGLDGQGTWTLLLHDVTNWADYGVNLPAGLENVYEYWGQVVPVDKIKEIGQKVENGDAKNWQGIWKFQTEWGQEGYYYENWIGEGDGSERQELWFQVDGCRLSIQRIVYGAGDGVLYVRGRSADR